MTSPVREIEIRCPDCNSYYQDWFRPSVNLNLDDFDDDYLEEASTSTCPRCGFRVDHAMLVVNRSGVWCLDDGMEGEDEDADFDDD
ncbi:MAG: hypothetical protein H8E31_02765 [Planctomycetes bacterium]|nr:hypothetical protein [Planctomycetota bacterium]